MQNENYGKNNSEIRTLVKYALSVNYLHQESANWALDMVLFLMLWCWSYSLNSSKIAHLEDAVPASICKIMMLNLHQI